MPPPTKNAEAAQTIAALRDALASSGNAFFPPDNLPPLTPQPFPLTGKQHSELETLGHRLFLFRAALHRIRNRSAKGKLPAWIAATLDGPHGSTGALPPLFCPELTVTRSGWRITGDALPGRVIPLLAALTRAYEPLSGTPLIAPPDEDALTTAAAAPSTDPASLSASGIPFALLNLRSLRSVWRGELRDSQFQRLEQSIPYTWLLDPAPLPPQAAIPRLGINSLRALADFTPEKRAGLVLVAPGDDPPLTGRDADDEEWRAAVTRALESVDVTPSVLQERTEPATVAHPVWNPETGNVETRELTLRLIPVYRTEPKTAALIGVLATLGANVLAPCTVP